MKGRARRVARKEMVRTVRPEIWARMRAWAGSAGAGEGRAPFARGGKAPGPCWLPFGRRALVGPGVGKSVGRPKLAGDWRGEI